MTAHRSSIACIALLLGACSSGPTQHPPGSSSAAAVAGTVTTPLADLNVVRAKIPAVLVAARKQPYAAPEPMSCEAIAIEVAALDAALGPDLDAPKPKHDANLAERSVGAADNVAAGTIRSVSEDVVPFRGWLRKLSGAERHSKEVESAILAGMIRRAYLKGLGQSAGCTAPAAPLT